MTQTELSKLMQDIQKGQFENKRFAREEFGTLGLVNKYPQFQNLILANPSEGVKAIAATDPLFNKDVNLFAKSINKSPDQWTDKDYKDFNIYSQLPTSADAAKEEVNRKRATYDTGATPVPPPAEVTNDGTLMVMPEAGNVPWLQASIVGVPKRVLVTNSVRYCVGLNAGLVENESSAAAINEPNCSAGMSSTLPPSGTSQMDSAGMMRSSICASCAAAKNAAAFFLPGASLSEIK